MAGELFGELRQSFDELAAPIELDESQQHSLLLADAAESCWEELGGFRLCRVRERAIESPE